MAMSINRFYSNWKSIKLFVQDNPKVSEELKSVLKQVDASFKAHYNSETFKAALMADESIPDDLEENITSAYILYNNEKARL